MADRDGTRHPDQIGAGQVTKGPVRTTDSNPVDRTGRSDGTELGGLSGRPESVLASGWRTGMSSDRDPSVQRTGRPDVEGYTTRGYPVNERGANVPVTEITTESANPGGKITPA